MFNYDVVIIGSGLSGLAAASRLKENSPKIKIAIISSGDGATPLVAALNTIMPNNPFGDSPEIYAADMVKAGYKVNDRKMVEKMSQESERCYKLLKNWGVEFSTKEDGQLLLRHASGSSYPRSLCRTTELIGKHITEVLKGKLLEQGVTFFENTVCHKLLVENNKIHGVLVVDKKSGDQNTVYAPVVFAAWGGVGHLFPDTTYPYDIDGCSLAMAFEAGAELIDLEFLEFEPLVAIWPEDAKGEPCPTAMLGEGAYLKNSNGERFILNIRPEGEAGTPKTVLNEAIYKEIVAGNISPHGGVYVDLRHIPIDILKSYPWFYNRVKNAGLNLKEELLEVRPAAHSLSGGLAVNSEYQTNVEGLYAVGEAMGGIHGACRMAGNAAAQALISGVLGAESVLGSNFEPGDSGKYNEEKILVDKNSSQKLRPMIRIIVGNSLGFYKDGKEIEKAINELYAIINSEDANNDLTTRYLALSGLLIAKSCLLRTESRGSHKRVDYPDMNSEWQCSIKIIRSETGDIAMEKVVRN